MPRHIHLKIASILLLMSICIPTSAQRQEKVHGKYSYTIGENEQITLFEVKQNCIRHARNEAIKEKFPELISASTNMTDASINGKVIENFVEEVTISSRAEWISDTRQPSVTASYENGNLTFTAEVWGEAREIRQSHPDFEWKILCGGTTDSHESNVFRQGSHIYIKFRSPADGYLAIYILDSTSESASCLLPYRSNGTGYHKVKAGEQYVFFDGNTDPEAHTGYIMTTKADTEMDNVVLIYSPNQFTKCNDITGDHKHPNSLSTNDFEKWLRKLRIKDKDVVVDRSRWITIVKN